MSQVDKQALRDTSDRDWSEHWFKSGFHPDKTGPYIKDQLFFAIRAARKPLLDENEALAAENERLKQSANEMQAQGAERCAAWFQDNHEYCRLLVTMMREFAKKLREGKA